MNNIKLVRTGNLYSISEDRDLQIQMSEALIHYAKKHGLKPATIIMNPKTLNGLQGILEIESQDNGDVYKANIVSENSVNIKTMLVTNGGE